MQYVRAEVSTICMGQAASAAAVLLAAGARGKRFALPHARILMHQPHGEVGGQAVDIEIHAREILRQRHLVDEILARHTGQPLEKISRDTDRDFILAAEQAKDYGVIDEGHLESDAGPPLRVQGCSGTRSQRPGRSIGNAS
jgi:ATP-dependent Clp protease protease subunit